MVGKSRAEPPLGRPATQLTPPAGFVAVDAQRLGEYDYRAVSADGAVVAAAAETTSQHGDLAFWSKAASNQLQERGYKLVKQEDVTSTAGMKGQLLEFSQVRTGTPYSYFVAIFPVRNRVIRAEAGGKTEQLEPLRAEIVKSLLSVR